jgi:hypothetical protein
LFVTFGFACLSFLSTASLVVCCLCIFVLFFALHPDIYTSTTLSWLARALFLFPFLCSCF